MPHPFRFKSAYPMELFYKRTNRGRGGSDSIFPISSFVIAELGHIAYGARVVSLRINLVMMWDLVLHTSIAATTSAMTRRSIL